MALKRTRNTKQTKTMSYLRFLKRTKINKDVRWIVKYNSNEKIREIKQIHNPKEYNKRKLLTQSQLIKIIESNNEKSIADNQPDN